jgi:YfiH family protein
VTGLQLLRFGFDGPDVRAVVTTRHGGVSPAPYASLNLGDHVGDDPLRTRRNRELLAEALSVGAITIPDQTHQATCAVVDESLAGKGFASVEESVAFFPATDALVSNRPGVALGIVVADCAPVLFWDAAHRAIGAAHCGRRGTVKGVLASTATRMRDAFGSEPRDLRVGIGPCIGLDSYEVGAAEAGELEAVYPDAGLTRPSPGRPGHFLLDLGGAVERQLADLGVPAANVERMRIDTRTSTDTFFSDRAERPCGRFMGIIALAG